MQPDRANDPSNPPTRHAQPRPSRKASEREIADGDAMGAAGMRIGIRLRGLFAEAVRRRDAAPRSLHGWIHGVLGEEPPKPKTDPTAGG
jgi:hypothetical protein